MKILKYKSTNYLAVRKLLSSEEIDPHTGMAYDMELFNKNNGTHFKQYLAFQEKELIGVIVFSTRLYMTEINYVFVKDSYRGLGIAQKLMSKVEQVAIRLKSEGIIINTAQDNLPARKFYEKLGYKQTGEVFDYFNHGKNQIFYHKKL